MPILPTDFANLIPDPEQTLRAVRSSARHAWVCPNGHPLPRRLPHGRCSPVLCCDTGVRSLKGGKRVAHVGNLAYSAEMDLKPRGMELEVLNEQIATPEEAEASKELAQAKLKMLRARAIHEAKKGLTPTIQDPPSPPSALSGIDYQKERLKQITPMLMELTVHRAMYGSEDQQERATKTLLDLNLQMNTDAGAATPIIMLVGAGGTVPNPYLKGQNHGQAVRIEGDLAGAGALGAGAAILGPVVGAAEPASGQGSASGEAGPGDGG